MNIDLSELTDGFSSKLKVISYFMAIIILKKKKKELFIFEKKSKEAPYLFTDLCLIKKFKVYKLKKKPKSVAVFNPYNYLANLKVLKKHYNIKDNERFNYVSELSYQNYSPKQKIKNKIKKINLPKKFIGIHFRSTDREINIRNFIKKIQFKEMIFDFHINHMIKNIVNFVFLKKLSKNVFICSDNSFYKKTAINFLKSKLLINSVNSKFNKNKFRQTNGIDFITELFCLSQSQVIISSVGGAVTNSAYLISKKKIKIYKWIDVKNFFYFLKIIILCIYWLKKFKNFLTIKII